MQAHERIPIIFILSDCVEFPATELSGSFSAILSTFGSEIVPDSGTEETSEGILLFTSDEAVDDETYLRDRRELAGDDDAGLEDGGGADDVAEACAGTVLCFDSGWLVLVLGLLVTAGDDVSAGFEVEVPEPDAGSATAKTLMEA